MAEHGEVRTFGHSTVNERAINKVDSADLRRALLTEIQSQLKKLTSFKYGDDEVQFLTHAETQSLLLLKRELGGTLPSELTIYVDRILCPSCQTNLGHMVELFGMQKLFIVDLKGNKWEIYAGQKAVQIR